MRLDGELVAGFDMLAEVLDDGVGRTVKLSIERGGEALEREIKVEDLVPKLKAITDARGGTDERIYVRGDRNVNYGTVMRVMGRLSAAGYRRVALVTEVEQGT